MTEPFDRWQHELVERMHRERQPSLSVAAARAGDVVWAAAVGDANPLGGQPLVPTATTRYRVASITKPQVAVAVLALVEAGEVDLAAPMCTWLPDAPAADASVAQFLSHTSGLVAEPDGPWWERAGGATWDDLVAMPLGPHEGRIARPGLGFHYSNLGYAVLGRLLEVVHERTWHEVLREVVWTPLGMAQTDITGGDDHAVGVGVHPLRQLVHPEPVPPYLAMGPAGEVWSTPSDLAVFGAFLAGAGDGRGVLRPDTLALMRHPAALALAEGYPWDEAYGLGLRLQNPDGRVRVLHTGSVPGFTAQLALDPRTGAALAICGNATHRQAGVQQWLDEWAAGQPSLVEQAAVGDGARRPLPDRLVAIGGLWYRGTQPVHVVVHDDEVVLTEVDDPDWRTIVRTDARGNLRGTSEDFAFGEQLLVDPDHPDDPRWFTLARLHHARLPYDPDSDVPGGLGDGGWRPWR
ncbi:serine hydrolase domain-containing protein [Propionibacteriaceae bacterium G1746]